MSVSYIVPYRSDGGWRPKNLAAVVRWLSTAFDDLEVLVVEQDGEATLDGRDLPRGCKPLFVFNDGPFNKAWAFNVGARRATGDVLALGDADVIMDAEALASAFTRCRDRHPAVKPYGHLVDLTPEETLPVLCGDFRVRVTRAAGTANREAIGEHLSFGGGLFVIRRAAYAQLGGFDERFRGWGGEDDAMTMKLRLLADTATDPGGTAFHLFHERATPEGNPYYGENLALLRGYAQLGARGLKALCVAQRASMGDPHKYAREALAKLAREPL